MSTLKCLLHPHHISLIDTHAFKTRLNGIGDPYYNIDGLPSHRHVLAPKFDVFETSTAFVLVGELPGLAQTGPIYYEWLEDQTLFIRGRVEEVSSKVLGDEDAKPKKLHFERNVGEFERSFTFPAKVTPNVEEWREDGLLRIAVKKI